MRDKNIHSSTRMTPCIAVAMDPQNWGQGQQKSKSMETLCLTKA